MQATTTLASRGQAPVRALTEPTHASPNDRPPRGARRAAQALTVLLWAIGSAYLIKGELAEPAPDWTAIVATPLIWATVIALPVIAGHALAEWRLLAAGLLTTAAVIGAAYTMSGTLARQAEKRDVMAAAAADTARRRAEIEHDIATARARLAAAQARCDAGRTCLPDTKVTVIEREWDVAGHTRRLAELDRSDPLAHERRIAAVLALARGGSADDWLPLVGLVMPALLGFLLEMAAFACAVYGFHPRHSESCNEPSATRLTPPSDTTGQSDFPAITQAQTAAVAAILRPDVPPRGAGPSGGQRTGHRRPRPPHLPDAPASPAAIRTEGPQSPDKENSSGTVREAVLERILADHAQRRKAASQRELSERYGVPRSTLSDWLTDWEASGHLKRRTVGRRKVIA